MISAWCVLACTFLARPENAFEARLEFYKGRPTIFLNGKPEAPLIYHLTGRLSNQPWLPEAQDHLRDFAKAGYRLFACEISLGSIWTRDGLDVEHVRRQFRAIREVRPDAAVLLRVFLDPPEWWLDAHPEEKVGYTLIPDNHVPEAARVRPQEWKRASYASALWKEEAGRQLHLLLERLAASGDGDGLFAVLLCGGEWGEWFYPGFEYEPDNGIAMTNHFREWLKNRYANDDAIRAAWNDSAVTLATAEVPSADVRFRTTQRMFRDPSKERQAIDYYRCHQEAVAETPLQFCRIVKHAWPRPVLVGLFHAYFFHLTHQASGGHLEMQRVLDAPEVDFLSSPFSYEFNARFLGGTGHYRCLTASIQAHKKLWMNENDHPTMVGDHFGRPGPFAPSNLEDSVATMRRNTAHCYTLGQGMWWFDFGKAGGNGAGGWWEAPALMEEARDELRLARQLMERPYEPVADVLLVYDTECFYYLAPMYLGMYNQSSRWDRTETLSFEAINETVAAAYKSGVAFDTVHIDDLPRLDLSRYRVVVYAFTPYLDETRRSFFRRSVQTPGRTVVWVYAPGYADGKNLDLQRVAQITGISIEESSVNLPPQLLVRADALAPGFPETRSETVIHDAWTAPTFKVTDPDAQTLGYYGGSREVALARKSRDGVTSFYSALPLKDPNMLREIFRQGGAHIYSEKNDTLLVGGPVLCVHTETGGDRTITLRNGRKLELALAPWTTIIFDAVSGETLLR